MGSNPVRVINNASWRITQVAEGNGLENRQVGSCRREGSNPSFSFIIIAGWSSLVARRAHNPKVAGSNPAPAIELNIGLMV